jgi:formylglycine-generating enzyme required for sulfatase activity/serine/threonine protein phosphatase PrpC
MSFEFDIAADQIDGARDYQEDAYMVAQLGDNDDGVPCALLIMADGMGGHAAGNVASNMVVATFNKAFQNEFPTRKIPEALTAALLRANQQIADSIKETPALRGMGCTMVAAYIEGNKLYWVSVGDSHLYLLRDRELIKQNADHSYGAYIDMMKEQGMDITEQPGMSRSMLMSAMTGEEISSIDCPKDPILLREGDRVIVASDGLDTLGAGAIIQYSSWSVTARECVYALLKAVEEANKINQDNTTVIVTDIKERMDLEMEPPAGAPREPLSKAPSVTFDPAPAVTSSPAYGFDDEEPRSWKWLMWLLLIGLLGGGGWYAWDRGHVDAAVQSASALFYDLMGETEVTTTEQPPATPQPAEPVKPEAAPSPPKSTPRPLVKQPRTRSRNTASSAKPFSDRLAVGGRAPKMVALPGGEFRMGGTGAFGADETPRHLVRVRPFAMSVYEVTFADYDRFAEATGRRKPSSNGLDRKTTPVFNVSWDNALAYAKWLSKQTGRKYRLPSEAEWEYAARAGATSSYWWGTDKGKGMAHCFDCGTELNTSRPARVGSYPPNPFGLYDTAGNLYEWVHDCYHRNYQGAPDDGSVWEGGDCSVRVVRGGAYRSPATSMRVENREKFPSNKGQYNVGIRLARDL